MTDHLHPNDADDPDAPAVDLAELDPKLQLALRHVANVDECCQTLLEILDAMPVIEGLTTTISDDQDRRPRIWIHDAIRACERLPGNWQRDVRRAWQLLGDAVNLYNQTVGSMGRYVERVNASLNGRLTTSAHKWARRFLDQYAGDLEHVQTLLEGSGTAFDELATNSLVSAQSSDPLADEMSIPEMMEMVDALAGTVLGKMLEAGHLASTEPAPLSNGTLLPLKLDPRPVTESIGMLPAPADDGAEVVAIDAVADDVVADDVVADVTTSAVDDQSVPAQLADETVAARCRRTVRRYQWVVGALCAAAVVILVVAGTMTYAAQERASEAAMRADVRIADAESAATRAVEQAQAVLDAPVSVEIETPGKPRRYWRAKLPNTVLMGETKVTLSREEKQ